MAARNRGSYSNPRRRGNGLAFVRGILIFGALAVLSFGFGFMVIARMLPMGTTKANTLGPNAVSGVDNSKDHVASAGSVTNSTTSHPAESVVPQTHTPINEPGPSIDPSPGDTKLQQPSSIDGDGPSVAPDPL